MHAVPQSPVSVPSFWATISPDAPDMPPLLGEARADVVVIGGGILGLSAALHLAEAGASVRVLEAETAGFGASGRNTGFVVPAFKATIGPDDVRAQIGADRAERLVDLVGGSGRHLFDLVRRHAIDCAADETGWMQPAHTEAVARVLEVRAREWTQRGYDVRLLDRSQTAARLGTDGYPAALMVPSGGQVNPLAYARGLARAAIKAGAHVHAATRVIGLDAARSGQWIVRCASGHVTAGRVLLATNALVDDLVPAVRDALVPVRVYQIATQPLPPDAAARILPGRSPASDTRRHTFAIRWSPDGRLLTGGLVMRGPAEPRRAARAFARRLAAFFPDHAPYGVAHVWCGTIAVLPASLPALFSVAPGLEAAIGCNGRGVALATALGRVLADRYAGRLAEDRMPLASLPPAPMPGRAFAAIGPSLWLPWSEFRDRLDTGRRA